MSDKLRDFDDNIKRNLASRLKKWDRPVWGYVPKKIERNEGDVWEEDGKTWTVKNGIKQSLTKLTDAKTPWWCPKCEKTMGHKFDTKFWRLYGMCYNCTIEWHTQMKLDGTYDEWERRTLRSNEKSYLRDKIQEIDSYINDFTVPQIVHEQGWEQLAKKEDFNHLFEHLEKQKESMLERISEIEEEERNESEQKE